MTIEQTGYPVKGFITSTISIGCGVPSCGVQDYSAPIIGQPRVLLETDAARLFTKRGWQKSINYQWVCKGHTLIRGKVLTDAPAT